jgi:hypothetical protein
MSDKYYVIDVNYLRDSNLHSFLSNSENESFVLTETVIIETLKSKNWATIYKKNFQIISNYVDKIYSTLPIGNILSFERKNKKVFKNLISEESTLFIREILIQLINENTDYIENVMFQNIEPAQEHISKSILDHSKNKSNWLAVYEGFLESSGAMLRTDLRKNRLKDHQLYELTINVVEEIFDGDRKFFGTDFDDEEINYFKNLNSNHYKLFATMVLNDFLWQIKRGLENIKEEKVTNEKHDIENIIIALTGKGILTHESYVNNLYEHIRNIVEIKFGKNE